MSGVVLVQIAFGIVKFKIKLQATDGWLILCLFQMGITYLLNPVGLFIFGSATVGSRPYIEIGIAVVGYLALSTVSPDPLKLKRIPILKLCVNGILSMGMMAVYYLGSFGGKLALIYSGFSHERSEQSVGGSMKAERIPYFNPVNKLSLLWGLTRIGSLRPSFRGAGITIMAIMFSAAASLLSGHRISVVNWVVYIGIYSILARNMKVTIVTGFIGFFGLVGVYTVHHTVMDIPLSAQRALTFLPGEWDYVVIQDAEQSTDWRIEMWETVITEEGLIKNKILGDGFGFSARELDLMVRMQYETDLSPEETAEFYLVTGDLHSGPLTAMRFTGIIGLVLFTGLSISVAVGFYRLCRRLEGTELWPVAAFFAIPSIWFPIKYIFLFGAYGVDFPMVVISLGIMKLIQRGADNLESETVMLVEADTK